MRWGWALLLVAACGGEHGSGAQFPFALYLDGAFPLNQLAEFQVTILTQGSSYNCSNVELSCVKGQVTTSVVPLTDSAGQTHQALTFPATLLGDGGVETQPVSVGGIPVGKDYLVVIEAVSNATPAALLGSSCNYVPQISAGTNPPLLAAPITAYPSGPVSCDPLF